MKDKFLEKIEKMQSELNAMQIKLNSMRDVAENLVNSDELIPGECFRKQSGKVVYRFTYVYHRGEKIPVGFDRRGGTTSLTEYRLPVVKVSEDSW